MKEQKSEVYSYQRCVFIAAVFQSPKPCGVPQPEWRSTFSSIRDTHRASGEPAMYGHKCRRPRQNASLPNISCYPSISVMYAMDSASLFGGGASGKSKQPAKMNIHSVQIGFVIFFVASGETCNENNNFFKKWKRFLTDTALLQRMCLFGKNALDAACK